MAEQGFHSDVWKFVSQGYIIFEIFLKVGNGSCQLLRGQRGGRRFFQFSSLMSILFIFFTQYSCPVIFCVQDFIFSWYFNFFFLGKVWFMFLIFYKGFDLVSIFFCFIYVFNVFKMFQSYFFDRWNSNYK